MNAVKHHWYETSLLRMLSCFEEYGVQDFIIKKSVQGTGSVSCQE